MAGAIMARRNASPDGAGTVITLPPDPVDPVDPTFPTMAAKHSDAFVELAEGNVHLAYGNSSAGETNVYRKDRAGSTTRAASDAMLATAFDELGIRYARETLIVDSTLQRERVVALNAAKGVKFKFTMGYGTNIPSIANVVQEAEFYGPGKVRTFTGPNETDNGGPSNWPALLLDAQTDLWNELHDDFTIGSPPLALSSHYSSFATPTLAALCHYADIHPYPGGGEAQVAMDSFITGSRKMVGTKPIEISENGYHNATASTDNHFPIPEAQAGIYYPRLWLEAFMRGALHWAPYEVADQYPNAARTLLQRWFGLYTYNWTPKLAALAVGRMSRLHADPGSPYAPARLPIRFGAIPSNLKSQLFGKRDGTYVLDLWRTSSIWTPARAGGAPVSVSSQNVTIEFPSPTKVTRYLPSTPAVAGDSTPFVPKAASSQTATSHTFSIGPEVNVLVIG